MGKTNANGNKTIIVGGVTCPGRSELKAIAYAPVVTTALAYASGWVGSAPKGDPCQSAASHSHRRAPGRA